MCYGMLLAQVKGKRNKDAEIPMDVLPTKINRPQPDDWERIDRDRDRDTRGLHEAHVSWKENLPDEYLYKDVDL